MTFLSSSRYPIISHGYRTMRYKKNFIFALFTWIATKKWNEEVFRKVSLDKRRFEETKKNEELKKFVHFNYFCFLKWKTLAKIIYSHFFRAFAIPKLKLDYLMRNCEDSLDRNNFLGAENRVHFSFQLLGSRTTFLL